MFSSLDTTVNKTDQGGRAQRLFAAVVLAALDDAIADDKKYGNGAEQIARWRFAPPHLEDYAPVAMHRNATYSWNPVDEHNPLTMKVSSYLIAGGQNYQ